MKAVKKRQEAEAKAGISCVREACSSELDGFGALVGLFGCRCESEPFVFAHKRGKKGRPLTAEAAFTMTWMTRSSLAEWGTVRLLST